MAANYFAYKGKRLLVLAGSIEEDSGKVVSSFVRNRKAYDEVWMCSPGGAVVGGKDIGKALNRARATVRTPIGFSCVSACTIAFMGGYVRIIDRGADFTIHASSRFSGFGFDEIKEGEIAQIRISPFLYDFYGSKRQTNCKGLDRLCLAIRSEIQSMGLSKYECSDLKALFDHYDSYEQLFKSYCAYFDDKKNFAYNRTALVLGSTNPTLVSMISLFVLKSNVMSELRLLQYYQQMLLDGRKDQIRQPVYNQINLNFNPTNIYDNSPSHVYARDLAIDMQTFKTASTWSKNFAVWQVILTDGELSLKDQIVDYIRTNNIDLGAAGKDALKIYDAMRTCQIQSLCRLERHTAEALGYHNLYDYE